MTLSVHLKSRSFGDILFLPRIDWRVRQLRWNAVGGPDEASIGASGPDVDLWECVELLRCPVEIHDQNQAVWWGYVESVSITAGVLTITISLETMYNYIKVTYTDTKVGGVAGGRASTGWMGDDLSRSLYGTKEKIVSISQGTAEQANGRLAAELDSRKYPVVEATLAGGGAGGEVQAEMICRGWWQTLKWTHWANPSGKVSYEEIGAGLQAMGDDNARQKLAQSFVPAGGSEETWQAETIHLRMKREKEPGDNLVVRLCADSSGAPGSTLATASMTGMDVDENLNWHEMSLSNRVDMVHDSTYWLVVERSGAVDAVNYYKIDANEALGYTLGAMRMWNGSAWVARSPDADMLFRVGGTQETSEQIREILGDAAASQFVSGVDIAAASGINSSPYREGDQTTLTVLEELMKSGGANGRRLLAKIDVYRRARIYEEPAGGEGDHFLTSEGLMSDALDRPLEKVYYPAGVWAWLKDVIPASVDTTRVASIERVFIEEVVYDAVNDSVQLGPRSAAKLLELE